VVTAFRGASLVAATIGIGVMAGVFFTYAMAVMPGLGRTDDRRSSAPVDACTTCRTARTILGGDA
jgi:uncharacterized membrane protein